MRSQIDHSTHRSNALVPMNNSSPSSFLSLANSPDGSPDHHDNVSVTAHTTQPRELPLLNGVQSHSNCRSDSTRNDPYAGALKFGVGGNGNSQVPTLEAKLCPQFPRGNLTGIPPLGRTS